MSLYAGVAETNITPPIGVWQVGYALRPSPCTDVHDELHARALVVNDGHAAVAILSMDLIGLDFDLVDRVRDGIAADLAIPREAVMLNATHTHSGPATVAFNAMGPLDAAYIDVLVRKLIGVARSAANRLRPASLAYGRAPVQIGVNRREASGNARVIGRNWAGPVQPWVDALVVRDSRDEPFAVLFSHACHAVTLGRENMSISADFCGYACQAVRSGMVGEVIPMFLQGCCGDINPLARGGFDVAERNGDTLGAAALDAADSAMPLDDARVSFGEAVVELPLIPPPPVEEIDTRLGELTVQFAEARAAGDVGRTMLHEGHITYARYEREIAARGDAPLTRPFAVQRIGLGGFSLIGLPAEAFVEYALNLAAGNGHPVITLGYTNGVHCYLPTEAAYAEGGYEVTDAFRYYGRLMFAPECERLVLDAAHDLLRAAG
jgi:neutral ceramidase